MQLYAGTSSQFIEDAFRGSLGRKLEDAFFHHYRYRPGQQEVRSWHNSLTRMSMVGGFNRSSQRAVGGAYGTSEGLGFDGDGTAGDAFTGPSWSGS
jgi:hypothetical protein